MIKERDDYLYSEKKKAFESYLLVYKSYVKILIYIPDSIYVFKRKLNY